jgi:alkanesulfonate monooxygenase SsuD/methylene tetrahydromethanopterin reductase-like flavin-dependent oxidoreductase (luciferase family)
MVTEQATIGSFVLNVMNRHPAVVARMAATLQAASGGRLALGIGIGGHPAEHEAYGIPFPPAPERAAFLREAIAVLRALLAGGPATFEGDHLRLTDAYARPVLALPPILVGAGTPAGIRLAAELGDGWAAEADTFVALEPRYREALEAAGRRRADQRVVLSFGGSRKKGAPSLERHPLVADPQGEVARWQAAGADEVLLTVRTTADVDALVGSARRW